MRIQRFPFTSVIITLLLIHLPLKYAFHVKSPCNNWYPYHSSDAPSASSTNIRKYGHGCCITLKMNIDGDMLINAVNDNAGAAVIPMPISVLSQFQPQIMNQPALQRFLPYLIAMAVVVSIVSMPIWMLQKMHDSVGIDEPTPQQLEEEDHTQCALFRHLPHLKKRLAWRNIGSFPTPVHRVECSARRSAVSCDSVDGGGRTVRFLVKREDLSSLAYGGNKVRTLQHQLAVVEAKTQRQQAQGEEKEGGTPLHVDAAADLIVFGSGGSNQVVATVVHSMQTKQQQPQRPTINTTALWMSDPPDLDNTLNMLSTLSFPNVKSYQTWSNPLALGGALLRALLVRKNRDETSGNGSFILPLGGNNPTGVLGQVGGALELAEQIEAGELPDCDGIYVAVGSSCTISGLIMGVALARKLGMSAYQQPGFALHMVPIHDIFALLNRAVGIYQGWGSSRYIPLTVRHSLHATCRELVKLGGPDVLAEALAILEDETVVHDDARLVGKYGAHSDPSRACAQLFDQTATVTDYAPANDLTKKKDQDSVAEQPSTVDNANHPTNKDDDTSIPGLWLCGHFTAKAMTAMCDDLLKDENKGKNMLFWQTKSRVQPRGIIDEWGEMQMMPPGVQEWADEGQPQSLLRVGTVDLKHGSAGDYRDLMTEI